MNDYIAYEVRVRVWWSFHVPESETTVTVMVRSDEIEPDFKALAQREVRRQGGHDGAVQRVIRVERVS